MIRKYKCKETFYIEKHDEDGRSTGKMMAVVKGSKWQEDTDNKYRICGGDETVRLDRLALKKKQWIEVLRETFERYFELVN